MLLRELHFTELSIFHQENHTCKMYSNKFIEQQYIRACTEYQKTKRHSLTVWDSAYSFSLQCWITILIPLSCL